MKWAEISIMTSHEATEFAAELFHDLGASGVVIEDPELVNNYIHSGLWDYTDIPEADNTEVVTIKAYLPWDDELDGKLRQIKMEIESLTKRNVDKGPGAVSCNEIQDEDWANNWKQYFHTEKIGKIIVIKPSWEDYEEGPDDIVIELDPGAAFGTGTHATTSMCIRALEELVRGGMDVFDVGTGSGVLAITAAKLGAAKVQAVDYDESVLKVAEENVAENGAADVVSVKQSDILQACEGKADLIVANIVADIIIRMFADVKAYLKEGGRILTSGIIADRAADVTKAARENGLTVEKVWEENGWTAMLLEVEEA